MFYLDIDHLAWNGRMQDSADFVDKLVVKYETCKKYLSILLYQNLPCKKKQDLGKTRYERKDWNFVKSLNNE